MGLRCYIKVDPAPNNKHELHHDHLGPVAALAACIKHQAGSTVLDVGVSLVAVIEVVLVGWVWVEAIGLSSAETRPCAATATAAATTAAATTSRWGWSMLCWCDWRQGVGARTAS